MFDLPQPVADAIAPAHLVVVPAENVSLSVREPELVGLTRVRGETPAEGSHDMTFRGQTGELHFAADSADRDSDRSRKDFQPAETRSVKHQRRGNDRIHYHQ